MKFKQQKRKKINHLLDIEKMLDIDDIPDEGIIQICNKFSSADLEDDENGTDQIELAIHDAIKETESLSFDENSSNQIKKNVFESQNLMTEPIHIVL